MDETVDVALPPAVLLLPPDGQAIYLSTYETAWNNGASPEARGGMGRNEFAQQEAWKAVHEELGDHPTTRHVMHPL